MNKIREREESAETAEYRQVDAQRVLDRRFERALFNYQPNIGPFPPYLFGSLQRYAPVIYDELKKPIPLSMGTASELVGTAPHPYVETARRLEDETIERILDTMTNENAKNVLLARFDGDELNELAKNFNLSRQRVGQLINIGLRQFLTGWAQEFKHTIPRNFHYGDKVSSPNLELLPPEMLEELPRKVIDAFPERRHSRERGR